MIGPAAVAFGFLLLVTIQARIVARDLETGNDLDLLASAFPIIWIDLALLVFTVFSLGIVRSRYAAFHRPGTGRIAATFLPDFAVLRRAFEQATFKKWAFRGGPAYAVVVMFLQRILVVDAGGNVLPHGTS